MITDILLTTSQTQNGVVRLDFTDGTNTVNIIKVATNNAPRSITFSPNGRFRGWKDGRIDLTVSGGNATANLTLGYIVTSSAREYSVWSELRGPI